MAKLSKDVISLTATGTAARLSNLVDTNQLPPDIKKLAADSVKAVERAEVNYREMKAFADKARADRRRTEFGREEYAAQGVDRLLKITNADLDTFIDSLRTAAKEQENRIAGLFVESSDTQRQHYAELRALVREKTSTPASVNVFVSSSDPVVGRAVLSAPLVLSNSGEGERAKMLDLYLAKHEPELHRSRVAVEQATDMLANTGQTLLGKAHELVDMNALNAS